MVGGIRGSTSSRPRPSPFDTNKEMTWPPDSNRHIFIRDFRLKVSIGIHDFLAQEPPTVVVNADRTARACERRRRHDRQLRNYDTVHDGISRLPDRHFNLQEALVDAILDLCCPAGFSRRACRPRSPNVYGDWPRRLRGRVGARPYEEGHFVSWSLSAAQRG